MENKSLNIQALSSNFVDAINKAQIGVKATVNYNTPNYDKALFELGWQKFEEHPIYFKKNIRKEDFTNKEITEYIVSFHVDFEGQQKIYEKMFNLVAPFTKDSMTHENMVNLLKRGFMAAAANNICKELRYDILLMLTADFYHHNRNNTLHQKYVYEYEKLSGKKY